MTSEFVHLHNHSDYSLLDGAQRIDQLVNTIDDLHMETQLKGWLIQQLIMHI